MPLVVKRASETSEEVRVHHSAHQYTTVLKAHCGCGADFKDLDLAELHAGVTGHTVHFQGAIRVHRVE